jgi:peptidylprolyl isomerase
MRLRIVPLLALAFAACGGSDERETTTAARPTATPTPIIEKVDSSATVLPVVTPSGKQEPRTHARAGDPPGELVVRDLERGDGAEATPGKTLTVEYKGAHYDSGKAFDSSWSTGQPFTLLLGANQVIDGWDQGLEGMRVGGRRELIVPPELAYGDHGQGEILPNETIVFVVDLLEVR